MRTSPAVLLLSLAGVAPTAGRAQDPAKERLDASPRHHEWIQVQRGERKLDCFVAFPEASEKVATVVVIHENKGLTDWVRSVADQLAESGYVAVAPDLLSGLGPGGGRSDSFASPDAATQALYKLDAGQVGADLDAVADHALKLPASSGALFVAGFCWGGGQAFDFATRRRDLKGAFVFYGRAPEDPAALEKLACPVHGFYGENDARINSAIPATTEKLKSLGKSYEPVIYAGAGHGFMRSGEAADASEPNRKARAEAWTRWKKLLAGA